VSRYLGQRERVDYDESLRAVLEVQEAGHDERPGKADSKWLKECSPKSLWHNLAQLAQRGSGKKNK